MDKMRKPAMKRKQGVDVVIALGPAPSKGPKMMDDDEYGDDMEGMAEEHSSMKSRCDALEKRIKRLESMLLEDEEEMDEEYGEDEGLDYEEEEDEEY